MALKLFQFVENNLIEKTGSIRKNFISVGYLIILFHFRNQKSITFFVTFTLLLFDSGVYFPFSNGNALNLKMNHKSNREKPNWALTNLKTFS